ncbi:MAG: FAD-dependent oxidoreductase [Aquabacterium sp.]
MSTTNRGADPTPHFGVHRVLIVGGGAGGLELATRLGRCLRPPQAEVMLVDASLTHVWKPLLHEVAAGSLDTGNNELDYLAHAHKHGFQFHLGVMEGLDRAHKQIRLKAMHDEDGQLIAEARVLHYDTLVMAVGSEVNDFHTPGVHEYALCLNTVADARRLHKRILLQCLRLNEGTPVAPHIAIIGGGATGVELATELCDTMTEYSIHASSNKPLRTRITLIEASPDLLPNLPPPLRDKVRHELTERGIQVMTGQRVEEVTTRGVRIAGGSSLSAQIVIWAAGVKAPEWLTQLDGLACNKVNQLLVTPTLQTTEDRDIFAMGDCAACSPPGRDKPVPPLAQAAHQQAQYLARVIPMHVQGRTDLRGFVFHDHGSLVSLGPDRAVGTLIGAITGHHFQVDGLLARLSYWTLYRGYLMALHGWLRMLATTFGSWLTHSTKSRVKLH